MLEVGDDVRRVRQEEEPQRAEGKQRARARAGAMTVVDENREPEGDPGEEEVPDQTAEPRVPEVRVAREHERSGEEREERERRVDRATAAACISVQHDPSLLRELL